ncbi:hypothetical protein [Sphingopyxis sp. Geo48]|uniref:hypothetical protein n=1 Tax=Sphingopyxis sp. Geo48 TaxID=545241 RepID=UPI0024B746B5|nr:hypothetical protein [Sphingopyxis sp. Geo48]
MDVLASGNLGIAVEAFAHGIEGGEADNRLMLGGLHVNAPLGVIQIARIVDTFEQFHDALNRHSFATRARPDGMRDEIAHDFGGTAETSRRIALKNFLDQRCHRFIAHQQITVTSHALELVTNRRTERPIAVHHATPHPITGCLPDLHAGVLRHGRENMLHQGAVGIFVRKIDGGRLQDAARFPDFVAERQMRFETACEARDVVDDDDMRLLAGFEECDHRLHRRAIDERTRRIVSENLDDLKSAIFRELFTAHALAFKSVAFAHLLLAGNSTVNYGFVRMRVHHGAHPFSSFCFGVFAPSRR